MFKEHIYHLPSRILGIFNFPSTRVKRSKLSHEYLKKKYKLDEIKGQEWKDQLFDAYFSNNKEKYKELASQAKNVDIIDFFIDTLICRFTKKDNDIEDNLELLSFYKGKYLKEITASDNELSIKTSHGEINVKCLSRFLPEALEEYPHLEDSERADKCHEYCVDFLVSQEEETGTGYRICTGYIAPLSQKSKVLHSWIEYKNSTGEWKCLDLTKNAIINRNGYYLYNNITGPVYKISHKTIVREYDKLVDLSHREPFMSKLYLSNRRQALKIYKHMIQQEQKEKIQDPLYRASVSLHQALVKSFETKKDKQKQSPEDDNDL